MAPPIMGGQMMQPHGTPSGFPPPHMPQGMPPPGMGPPMGGSQPNKTVLLQPTDGIVSVAQRGGAAIPSAVMLLIVTSRTRRIVDGAFLLLAHERVRTVPECSRLD